MKNLPLLTPSLGLFMFAAATVATQSGPAVTPGVAVIAQAVGPTGATLAQSPGPVAESSGAPISVTIGTAPSPGDLLVLFVVSATPIPVPAGFSTPKSAVTPGPVQVFYQLAGASAPTSYSLGSGTMVAQLFDITGEDQTLVPTISVDLPVGTSTLVSRNESVLTANGLTLAAFGGSSSGRYEWFSGSAIVSPSPPGGVTYTAYPQTVYGPPDPSSFGLALGVFQVSSEAFNATPNPFTFVGQFEPRPIYTGTATYNGVVLTVLPAPSPTATTNLVTPPSPKFYIGVRYNELSGNNGTYDQSKVPNFETDIGRTLAINSHFHYWTDIYPWANSTSNPYADSQSGPYPIKSPLAAYKVPYNLANTDEEDDAVNGRYVLTTWNCGDTDWNVAHGNEDDQISATAYRLKMFGQPIFVRYFHEMNLDSSSDDHSACLDGLASPNPIPTGYLGSGANLSGDTTPNPLVTPTTLGYFNYGEWRAAWMRVYTIVHAIAPNVIFVFVPSGGGMSDMSSFQPHLYYPGDEFVDWTGFDDYERRTFADFDDFTGALPGPCGNMGPTPGPTYYCPNTIYSEVTGAYQYTQGAWASSVPKPLFVAETAVTPASQPTWLASSTPGPGGTRSIIAQALGTPYPQIKALAYFDENGPISWVLTGAPPSPTPSLTPGTGYYLFTALANDAQSASGPSANPSPSPTPATFSISHGPLATSTDSPVTVKPSATPLAGDTLIAAVVTAEAFSSPLPVPTGWTVLTSQSPTTDGYLQTAYCVVSTTTCLAAGSYTFTTPPNGGIAEIFDIKNASTTATPAAAPDTLPTSFPTGLNVINELVRNLQVSTTGGFTMTIWAANASASVLNYPGEPSASPVYEIFPTYTTLYTHSFNMPISGNFLSLVSFKVDREIASPSRPFTAAARYYNNIPSIPEPPPTPTAAPTGLVYGDGTIIWLSP